jgi:hypothetical protein
MKKLEKLKVKNKKLRAKEKKTKVYSSSSEDGDSEKPSYNSMSFNYNIMPSFTAYTSIPVGKTTCFDGSHYNQWKHCMKNYLYSISPDVW